MLIEKVMKLLLLSIATNFGESTFAAVPQLEMNPVAVVI